MSAVRQGDLSEIILCADETSAQTARVAAELLRPTDSFLQLPHLRGPAETRNIGMSVARGQWVCFLDDDDSIEDGFFDRALPILRDSEDVVYVNYTQIREDVADDGTARETSRRQISLRQHRVRDLAVQNFIHVGALFIPRRLLDGLSFDPALASHEDWDFILHLWRRAGFRHADITGPNYHVSNSATRNDTGAAARADIYQQIYLRHKLVRPRSWYRRLKKLRHIRSQIGA